MGDLVRGGWRWSPAQPQAEEPVGPQAEEPAGLRLRGTDRFLSLPSGDGGDACPYQGLAPFEAESTELFFGRARATRDLLERLGERLEERGSVLLISGASGVGKSSLLRAGLLAALAEGMLPVAGSRHWPRLLITPTARPLRALAEAWVQVYGGHVETVHEQLRDDPVRALAEACSPAGRLVLVVDQFEELFTLVAEERERQAFVRALDAMAEGPSGAGVIVGVRADYWDRCAAYPQFAEAIQDGQVIVEPMTERDLRLAITGPAAAVGLEIESGLVETILAELRADRVAGDRYEAGALPLLSQALRNTWDRRESGRLTIRGYEESGRVRDSVQRTADEVLERLPVQDRKIALKLFRRMTVITTGGRVARRRATLSEIHAAASARSVEHSERVDVLLSAFAGQRLLTLHEDTVEIAHDALLTAWPALRQWLEPDLTAQVVHDRLIDDAAQWAENHRDPAFLYRGTRLLSVQDTQSRWDRDPDSFPPPGPTTESFIAASTRAALRAGRRRRRRMAGLAVLSALALIAAGVAVDAARDADHQRRLAISRQLAAQSEVVASDPVNSALLAVTAWRIAPTPEARHSMLAATARTGRGVLTGHDGPVTGLVFSSDGSIVATGSEDGTARLWATASRRQLGAPFIPPEPRCSLGLNVALSPDGRLLATACSTTVEFWDVSTHRLLRGSLNAGGVGVRAMAFSPDGRALATSSHDGTVRLWDAATRRRIGGTIGGSGTMNGDRAINAVAFSPDGKRLATAGADNTARLWDIASHQQIGGAFTGHTGDVHDVSFSPDGTTLATASTDGTARLWDLATHHQIGDALRDPDSDRAFYGTAFSPDGTRLVTAGANGFTRVWDTTSHQPVGLALADQRLPARRVAFSPDGRILATGGEDGAVRLWDPVAHREVGAAMPAASDVAFSPDGRILATPGPGVAAGSGDADRAVRLWDVASRRQVGLRLPSADGPASGDHVYKMRFSPDGRTLATASVEGNVRLWDAITHRQIGSPVYSDENTWEVEFSPDGRFLAIRLDRSIEFWDVAGRREIRPRISIPGYTNLITALAFSPDGAILAVADDDRNVRLFDVAARRQIEAPLPAATNGGRFDDLAFSPDGKTLATTAGNSTVRLWDVASHHQVGVALTGHTDVISAITFSPDGKTLVTGSADRTVRLWDLLTRRQIGLPLTGHTRAVAEAAYSPDGTTVATVGDDRTARLWNVAIPADPAATTCANAGRSLTRAEWERYIPGEKFQEVCP